MELVNFDLQYINSSRILGVLSLELGALGLCGNRVMVVAILPLISYRYLQLSISAMRDGCVTGMLAAITPTSPSSAASLDASVIMSHILPSGTDIVDSRLGRFIRDWGKERDLEVFGAD